MDDQKHSESNKYQITNKVAWIILTPALGALGYASLYLIGAIYNQTYLNHYGISSGFFEKNSVDYFFHAYSALLQTGTNWLSVITEPKIIFSTLGLTLLFVSEIVFLNWLPTTNFFKKSNERLDSSRIFRAPLVALLLSSAITLTLLALPLAANILLLAPAIIGVKSAEASYKRADLIFEQGCGYVKNSSDYCVSVFDGDDEIAKGFIIDSSNTHIALHLNGKTTIIPIKNYRLETILPSKKQK